MLSDNHLRGHFLPNTWGISLGSFGTCINFMFFAMARIEIYSYSREINVYDYLDMRKGRSGEFNAINRSKRLQNSV